jgi:hypothetical protein
MPIAILKIPSRLVDEKKRKDQITQAAEACNQILVDLIDLIGIPNSKDKEVMILVDENISESSFEIELTTGRKEYPDYPGRERFEPSDDLIRAVGQAVHGQVHDSLFGVTKTVIKAWANTTYVFREEQEEGEAALSEAELQPRGESPFRDEGGYIEKPSLTLFLPSEKKVNVVVAVERELIKELDPNEEFAREMARRTAEILGLPEMPMDSVRVVYADYADAQASVVFDCRPQAGHELSEGARQRIAEDVMDCLDKNPLTHNVFVEAWIRQGEPRPFTFPSEVVS